MRSPIVNRGEQNDGEEWVQLALVFDEESRPNPTSSPAFIPPEYPLIPKAEAGEAIDGNTQSDALKAWTDVRELTRQCRYWLNDLGLTGASTLVKVDWNERLQSTAGYASYPAWKIELNPKLIGFPGQVERTLKHELAHLIAYHRAGRRRIDPHGSEWREACAHLGIADEKACHHLPLPRRQVKRPLAYRCPNCGYVMHRVRKFRRATACLSCCNQHSGGQFDVRFRFSLIESSQLVESNKKKQTHQDF